MRRDHFLPRKLFALTATAICTVLPFAAAAQVRQTPTIPAPPPPASMPAYTPSRPPETGRSGTITPTQGPGLGIERPRQIALLDEENKLLRAKIEILQKKITELEKSCQRPR